MPHRRHACCELGIDERGANGDIRARRNAHEEAAMTEIQFRTPVGLRAALVQAHVA